MSTVTVSRSGSPTSPDLPGCSAVSPGGQLRCANEHCNGRGHVWVHESSARDRKRDSDGSSED